MGKCCVSLGEYDDAVAFYERALVLIDDYRPTYIRNMVLSYGYALLELKQLSKALRLELYEDKYADYADFQFLMALIYMKF